eukprot:13825150-Ditylum_brightwellii.AAC.1
MTDEINNDDSIDEHEEFGLGELELTTWDDINAYLEKEDDDDEEYDDNVDDDDDDDDEMIQLNEEQQQNPTKPSN